MNYNQNNYEYNIVIFGNGRMRKYYLHTARNTNVVMTVDNNVEIQNTIVDGMMVYSPQSIKAIEYDYVVIFIENMNAAMQVKAQLTNELQVPKEKILHWTEYVYSTSASDKVVYTPMLKNLSCVINKYASHSLLDIDMMLYKMGILSKHELYFDIDDAIAIYGICDGEVKKMYKKIYQNIYYKSKECLSTTYSVGLFGNPYLKYSKQEFNSIIKEFSENVEYFVICLDKRNIQKYTEWMNDLSENYKCIIEEYDKYAIIVIDNLIRKNIETKVFVVTHKKFIPVATDQCYIPIHAGRKMSEDLGYLGDDTGDNVSDLNPYINECSALYWMWKNVSCEYIGLNHYRRYFVSGQPFGMNQVLSSQQIERILSRYDIILPKITMLECYTLNEHMRCTMDFNAYDDGIEIVRKWMKKRVPDYIETLEWVINQQSFFRCQMFITKKHIMDQYCEWLFSFLIDAAREMKYDRFDMRSKRVIAFIAERLFIVWLSEQDLNIKEMPIIWKDTSYE